MKLKKNLAIAYRVDTSVSNRQERLTRAYGMIFDKIEQMETEKRFKEIERTESYGTATV